MANNRIYLRCKQCGDVLYLGKTFSGGYSYTDYDNINLVEKLNEFYGKHEFCIEELNNNSYEPKLKEKEERVFHYENQFDICYEFFLPFRTL